MGRIVVTEFVSMDGVMEAPGGERATRIPTGRSSSPTRGSTSTSPRS